MGAGIMYQNRLGMRGHRQEHDRIPRKTRRCHGLVIVRSDVDDEQQEARQRVQPRPQSARANPRGIIRAGAGVELTG